MARMHAVWARYGTEAIHPAIDVRASVYAGLIAGVVFMALEMALVRFFLGDSAWGPLRMIAAIVMGKEVLPPPATFSFGIVTVGLAVHFTLSIVFSLIVTSLIYGWQRNTALIVGMIFGLALYAINFYGFTSIFPWFAMARNWVSIIAHLVFGVVAVWSYKSLSKLN